MKHADTDGDHDSENHVFDPDHANDGDLRSSMAGKDRGRVKGKRVISDGDDSPLSKNYRQSLTEKYTSTSYSKNVKELLSSPLEPIEELLDPRLHGLPERVNIEGELRR